MRLKEGPGEGRTAQQQLFPSPQPEPLRTLPGPSWAALRPSLPKLQRG